MKNKIHIIIGLFIFVVLGLAGLADKDDQIVIVDQGKARAVILIDEQASEGVRLAADELQSYIKKISGVEIPIKSDFRALKQNFVFIGSGVLPEFLEVSSKNLGREGFRIKTTGNNLVLLGKDDTGTQYAVYTFLEKYLGVRWFWPGELGELVPNMETIIVEGIDDKEEPDFKWRNRGPGGALWGATSGPTDKPTRERLLGVSAEHQEEVALWEKRNKWGGMKIYGGHALGEIFPPEKYAETHPEYYAWVNGTRDVPGPEYDYKHEGQICTTNPDVVQVTVDWARKFFDEHPDYDGVHITMNDGGGFCECEKCCSLDTGEFVKRPGIDIDEMKKKPAKYTVITDRIFTFMNQVAEEIQKTHSGKYVVSMAYSRYTQPPERIQIHPFVVPQYCLWSAYKHANPEFKQKHEEIAAGWAKTANRTGIYEYHINGSWPGMHRIVMPYIAESIKYLHSQGIDLYQTQSGDEFAINGLNYFVAGKLLWDVSMDEKKILEDFYQKAFGKAANAVQQFHYRLGEAWKEATKDGKDVSCSSLKKTRLLELFTPQLLDNCRQDLEEAERIADNDLIRKRIEFYKKGFHYTELTVKATTEAKKLENFGIPLFPLDRAQQEIQKVDKIETKKMILEAINAWEKRNRFVEDIRDDYILAYFWVKYNDINRKFNPTENLKIISKILESN